MNNDTTTSPIASPAGAAVTPTASPVGAAAIDIHDA
jgi:hypothetical protein